VRLSGVTKGHIKEIKRALKNYKKYILSNFDKRKSLEYFNMLQRKYSVAYYKKQMYQIRKFLTHHDIEWAKEIKLPGDPEYLPKRISVQDIIGTLSFFENHKNYIQIKSIVLLGITSGLRAEELYYLTEDDIDLDQRMILVKHDPKNNHSTKTKKSRVSFFTDEAKKALEDYLKYYDQCGVLRTLFAKKTLERRFRHSPIKVKHLRKFFSQEWDRRGGPTSIKKILMGHSLKGDVDLMHYNAQSPEDLKKIYDKVMGNVVHQ
jgi:integrase/recombinase XerD